MDICFKIIRRLGVKSTSSKLLGLNFIGRLVALTLVTVCVTSVMAQPSGVSVSDRAKQVIEDMRRQGVNLSDAQRSQIALGIKNSLERGQRMEAEMGWSPKPQQGDVEILSHIKGSEGIPFPAPEEIVLEPLPTIAIKEAPSTPLPIWSPEPYIFPRLCERSKTEREALPPVDNVNSGTDTEEEVFSDYLFIDENLVPLDPQESFGEKTTIYRYGPNSGSATEVRMEIYRVPCVPYRVRTTNLAKYTDTGDNALKNYSKNPAGKGVLSRVMAQKIVRQK